MEKSKSKKTVIIISIIVIVLVLAGVGGYLGYQQTQKNQKQAEENQGTGTDWADRYFEYIDERSSTQGLSLLPNEITDGEIQFIQLQENETPIMVMKYKDVAQNRTDLGVYGICEDGQIAGATSIGNEIQKDVNVVLLYNRKRQEYRWYQKLEKNDGQATTYTDLAQSMKVYKTAQSHKPEDNFYSSEEYKKISSDIDTYYFKEEDMPKENQEGENKTAISKFEETFLTPPEELTTSTKTELNSFTDKNNLKQTIKQAVNGYKDVNETITEEVKTATQDQLTKIEETAQNIKKAQEEAAKKAAEEEAAKKAAEGLKVGKHTLKYGTYKSDVSKMDSKYHGTITLRQNGTFHIKANYNESSGLYTDTDPLDCEGTYKVQLNEPTGYPGEVADMIHFTPNVGDKFVFEVIKNNAFSDQWHGYSYSGN